MSEIKHTPGPWSVHSDDGDDWLMVMAGGPSWKIVANVNPETFSAGVADLVEMPVEANARLIAAAPTMHEYIAKRADAGDNEAKQILESINAGR